MKRSYVVLLILFGVILVDQILKIWVKTHFSYNQEIALFGNPRLLLHFVENDGMAFGLRFGGDYGKLGLSIFRLLAVILLAVYVRELVRELRIGISYVIGFALVLAGAIGNIIDSLFYGLIFSSSKPFESPAEIFPAGGGYAPLFYGKVVDMFYFPLVYGKYPDWFPWWGGETYLFFKPVFNVADVAITTGVLLLLFIQIRQYVRTRRKLLTHDKEE